MGWLARIFGKEKQITTTFTQDNLTQISNSMLALGKEVKPTERTAFDDVNQHFTNLRAALAQYWEANTDLDQIDKERKRLFEEEHQSLAQANAQTSRKRGKLLNDRDKAEKAIKVKLTAISIELNKKQTRYPTLVSQLREILEPLFVTLGNEVKLPKYTIDSAIPK